MQRFIIVIALLLPGMAGNSQLVPEGIVHAFKTGDARELSTFFHNSVEIQILTETQIISKNQATRIMQDFFNNNPPISFDVNYEDFKPDTKYGLGTMRTTKDSFNINIYFMELKKKKYIYYLHIEKTE
jgi:hypothetical protein